MEKKKLLLVAVSVGVFLAITISLSIIIFAPKTIGSRSSVTGTSSSLRDAIPGASLPAERPAIVDASELVRNPDRIQETRMTPLTDTIQEDRGFVNSESTGGNYTPESGRGDNAAPTIISIPRPSTAAVPDPAADARPRNPAAASPAPPVSTPPASPSPATPAPSPTPAAAATAAKPAAKAMPDAPSVKSTAVSRPAVRKVQNDYWIQTGSFKNKTGAEKVRETLAQKGITSIIQTVEKDGTHYRVRVGPYTSETEANYWLALVKSIEGFDKSLVMSQSRSPL